MPTSTPIFAFDLPTVGGDLNNWGGFLNGNFTKIENLLNGTVGPRLRPDLDVGLWEIGGVAVTADAAELNKLDGATVTTVEINKLAGATLLTADLNLLTGLAAAGLSTSELGHVNGVTSAIQTQLNSKQAEVLTTDGDIVHRAGGVTSRLALGAAGQYLRVNAGATALQYASPQVINTSGGTLTDLTTSFANRLSVSFVATGASAVLTAGVGSSHASATITEVLAQLRIYDTVSLTDVATSEGGEHTASGTVSYATRFNVSVSINTLVPGRTYEAQLWLRKTVSAGPTLPRDLRIDGICM